MQPIVATVYDFLDMLLYRCCHCYILLLRSECTQRLWSNITANSMKVRNQPPPHEVDNAAA